MAAPEAADCVYKTTNRGELGVGTCSIRVCPLQAAVIPQRQCKSKRAGN